MRRTVTVYTMDLLFESVIHKEIASLIVNHSFRLAFSFEIPVHTVFTNFVYVKYYTTLDFIQVGEELFGFCHYN